MAQGYGEYIRNKRESWNWSQEDLAARLAVGPTTVSKWENEISRPTIEDGNSLIIALNLPAEGFWLAMGAYMTPPEELKVIPYRLLQLLLEMPEHQRQSLTIVLDGPPTTDAPRPKRRAPR